MVEGVETAKALCAVSRDLGVQVPIIEAVHRVLFEGLAPGAAVRDLMGRAAGAERIA